jgi:pimeloyl-ACP methyl ester carboxylesterase
MTAPLLGQSIDLPAGPIHYRHAGPANGRPIVFVHGFLVDDTVFGGVPKKLARRGLRTYSPTWPLGSHRTPMAPDADLSPRGVAKVVLSFLEALDLRDVVLVGNDTGGAICQFVLDEDPSRIGALVLTNCDAFDQFPPFPFNLMFRLSRHRIVNNVVMQGLRLRAVRNSVLGFGGLVESRLTDETIPWSMPYLQQVGVRRDVARFARGWRRDALSEVQDALARFDRPVLLTWGQRDRFFTPGLGRRLAAVFPSSRLVEISDARTFVSLDQPDEVADAIASFLAVSASA